MQAASHSRREEKPESRQPTSDPVNGTSLAIGGITRYGELVCSSVGRIYFACSDIAGAGYMHVDRAIRMGEGAAELIVQYALETSSS